MNTLKWKFDHEGTWEANSICRPGYMYRIVVLEDGTFSVMALIMGLWAQRTEQPTLVFAKMECELCEGWLQIESKHQAAHQAALALASPLPLNPTDEEFVADEEISHDSNGTA